MPSPPAPVVPPGALLDRAPVPAGGARVVRRPARSPRTPRPRSTSTPSCGRAAARPACVPTARARRGGGGWRPAPPPARCARSTTRNTAPRCPAPSCAPRATPPPATGRHRGLRRAGRHWQLWQEAYGRNSLDGKGLPLVATVHFGTNYDNAFWDGTQMVFGDGDGVIFLPFTRSVDVIGHELAHGVTQYTSGLNYQDQSGALNESVSDVFGVLVKQRRSARARTRPTGWSAPSCSHRGQRRRAAVDGGSGHRLRRPPAGQGPPARPPARLRRHHRRQRRGAHQLRYPQQGLPRRWPPPWAATPGRSPAGLVRHRHRRHQGRLRLRHVRPAHRRRGHGRHGADSEVVTAVRAGWDAVGVTTGATAPVRAWHVHTRRVRRGVGFRFGLGRHAGAGHPGQRPPHRRVRRAHRRAHRRVRPSCPTATRGPGTRCSPTTGCPRWPTRSQAAPGCPTPYCYGVRCERRRSTSSCPSSSSPTTSARCSNAPCGDFDG